MSDKAEKEKESSESWLDPSLCGEVKLHIALCKKKMLEKGKKYPFNYANHFIHEAMRLLLKKERREILGEMSND